MTGKGYHIYKCMASSFFPSLSCFLFCAKRLYIKAYRITSFNLTRPFDRTRKERKLSLLTYSTCILFKEFYGYDDATMSFAKFELLYFASHLVVSFREATNVWTKATNQMSWCLQLKVNAVDLKYEMLWCMPEMLTAVNMPSYKQKLSM